MIPITKPADYRELFSVRSDPENRPLTAVGTDGRGNFYLRSAAVPDDENATEAFHLLSRDDLKEYAQGLYSDEEFEEKRRKYDYGRPFTKESLLYRELFEKYYPGQGSMIADFWMPNREWEGCDVNDPSARVLANYGESGQ